MAFESSPRISVLLSRLTATRAGYLDELAAGAIPGDIDGIIADIGVFPTANYATLAAYVEDIRTRLIAIVADTGELQTDWADGGRLDLLIDAIKAKTDTIVWANITTIDGVVDSILADTATIVWGDITTIDGIVDAIKAQTDDLADGERLDLIFDGILADTGELQTDWVDGGRLDLLIDAIKAKTDTIVWGDITTIDGIVDSILADTATIVWGDITTIDTLIDGIVADVGVFPTANYASLAAYVEDIRTRLTAIVGDTNELQTDWVNGGRLDLIIDDILADTATIAWGDITTIDGIVDDILADTATIVWGDITTIDGIVDTILVDTNELQTDWTDGGRLDLLLDGVITRLDNGTYGLSALDTDLGTLLTRLSAARAGYLDNLIGAETAGTYNHPDGVVEQDAVEITPAELIEYYKLVLDVNALTQTVYLRTSVKVDGATYRQIDYAEYPADYPTNTESISILLLPSSKAVKVTMQSAIGEGAIRAVPYFYVSHNLT